MKMKMRMRVVTHQDQGFWGLEEKRWHQGHWDHRWRSLHRLILIKSLLRLSLLLLVVVVVVVVVVFVGGGVFVLIC